MKMKMLTPLNWFGKQVLEPAYEPFDAAQFRRFLNSTLVTPSRKTISTLTTLANMDEDDDWKDEMVESFITSGELKFQDLDWRDYR